MPRLLPLFCVAALLAVLSPPGALAQGEGAAPVETAAQGESEFPAWYAVRRSTDRGEIERFLDRFPEGHFAPAARARLAEIARPDETAPGIAAADGDPEASPLVRACDARAADPRDPTLPQGAGGVPDAALDALAALEACDAARAAFPGHGRTAYNQGRAELARGAPAEAEARFLAAQARGHVLAGFALGQLYQQDESFGRSPIEALELIVNAAYAGLVPAQTAMGLAYGSGTGVNTNPAEAALWYQRAAEQGDPVAMFELGWAFENGLGVPFDPAEAALWYGRGAKAGNLLSMNNLGWLHAQGLGVERDPEQAVALYRAAAQGGLAIAMGNLGWMLENGIGTAQDLAGAAAWYRRAAAQDEPQSMLNLGNLYLTGNGVVRDATKALDWFEKARAAGRVEALSYIGEVYERSPELRDPVRAAETYLSALRAGDAWVTRRAASEWERETARAMQEALAELGLYTGPIDAIMGAGSRAAMQALLAQGPEG